MLIWILLGSSLLVLGLGIAAWRTTQSRPLAANIAFASFGLLFTAFQAHRHGASDWVAAMAFLIMMLLVGRALGTWMRSLREPDLQKPARFLGAAAGCALIATSSAVWPLLR